MRKLNCFVIIPSNRNGKPIELILDDKWGLAELPSGCRAKKGIDPISIDFDDVYNLIIKPAIDEVNTKNKRRNIEIEHTRGQDLAEAGEIIPQLIEHICKADITITDTTTHNPNVFLEYGIRLSVKDPLNILIHYEGVRLPFNIEGLRAIPYTKELEGSSRARNAIVDFIQTYITKLEDNRQPVERSSIFRRNVELFNGRQLERQLISVFEGAPTLVADFLQFLYVNGNSLQVRQKSFKFLEEVKEILKDNPSGQQRAIQHLEMVSLIQGLSREKLQETYLELAELCDADPSLKDKGEEYLRKAERLEED